MRTLKAKLLLISFTKGFQILDFFYAASFSLFLVHIYLQHRDKQKILPPGDRIFQFGGGEGS